MPVNTACAIYFFLIHRCTNSLSSLHIYNCRNCDQLHIKICPGVSLSSINQSNLLLFTQTQNVHKSLNKSVWVWRCYFPPSEQNVWSWSFLDLGDSLFALSHLAIIINSEFIYTLCERLTVRIETYCD